MTRRDGAAQAAATRPMSALVSAALLLFTAVAGMAGIGGFSAPGKTSSGSVSTATTPSTLSLLAVGERRAATVLAVAGKRQHAAGWAAHHPEPADVPGTGWSLPGELVDPAVEAGPVVIALTTRVPHRGRAPPAGSLPT